MKMYDRIKNISPIMSREQILALAIKHDFNGEYITEICKQCGTYKTNETAHTKDAIIVDKCDLCHYHIGN